MQAVQPLLTRQCCVSRHRKAFIGLADKGCYLALQFPNDDPPGWYWGKPLSTGRTGKGNFWVDYGTPGEAHDTSDDVKVEVDEVPYDLYQKRWAVVAPKDFALPPAGVEVEEMGVAVEPAAAEPPEPDAGTEEALEEAAEEEQLAPM